MAVALAGALLAPACASSRDPAQELLRATGAKTILLDERVALYSPYDWVTTKLFVGPIEGQRGEVFDLFGVRCERQTEVWLRVDPRLGVHASIEGERLRIESVSFETHDGILGEARDGVVTIRVAPLDVIELPDGRTITGTFGVEMYTDTIRHEMAHAAAFHLGIVGKGWLAEGLAHTVEWIPWESDRLRLAPVPKELGLAARLPRTARSLAAVLAWEQSFPVTDDDRRARLLAFSLVAFLIDGESAPTFRERALHVAAMDERRILALESAWSAWLDRIAEAAPSEPSG